jgi:hypothetical protein
MRHSHLRPWHIHGTSARIRGRTLATADLI